MFEIPSLPDLPEIPDASQTPFDGKTLIERIVVGGLFGALVGGFSAALASLLLGAVGARLGREIGEVGTALGGGVGVAICGVWLPRGLAECLRPWWKTALRFLAGIVVAAGTSWLIGTQFEWRFYRWCLPGAALGIFMGALCEPVSLARGGKLEMPGKAGPYISAILMLTRPLSLIRPAQLGAFLAGMIGGAVGGLFPSWMVARFGGEDIKELLGSDLVVLICGAAIGALAGGSGGWLAWGIPRQAANSVPIKAEQDAAPDSPRDRRPFKLYR